VSPVIKMFIEELFNTLGYDRITLDTLTQILITNAHSTHMRKSVFKKQGCAMTAGLTKWASFNPCLTMSF